MINSGKGVRTVPLVPRENRPRTSINQCFLKYRNQLYRKFMEEIAERFGKRLRDLRGKTRLSQGHLGCREILLFKSVHNSTSGYSFISKESLINSGEDERTVPLVPRENRPQPSINQCFPKGNADKFIQSSDNGDIHQCPWLGTRGKHPHCHY